MSKKYKIGQVLYIISPKTQTVVPVQVHEINQKTTRDGMEVHYMVMDPEERGPHNLENINGKIYASLSDASKFLKENANKAIDSMIAHAEKVSKESFGEASQDIFPLATATVTTLKQKKKSHKKQVVIVEPMGSDISMVEVIGKNGKSVMQKTKIRSVTLPGGESVKSL